MRHVPTVLLVIALAAAAPLSAIASPQSGAADLEREARAIDATLIAPCCFSQTVSVHASPAADEVRRDVRARLAAGETRRQILDAYVARYGKRILAMPPAAGVDVTLYVIPLVVLLASAVIGVVAIRRFTHRSAAQPAVPGGAPPPDAVSAAEETRLDDELRDLD